MEAPGCSRSRTLTKRLIGAAGVTTLPPDDRPQQYRCARCRQQLATASGAYCLRCLLLEANARAVHDALSALPKVIQAVQAALAQQLMPPRVTGVDRSLGFV